MAPLRTEFDRWRNKRPFWGGVMMMIAGFLISWFPVNIHHLLSDFTTSVGLLFGVLVFMTGVFSLVRPRVHGSLGVMGVVFSILSFFGAFGGLLVGMFVGIVGGSLTYSWIPPDDAAGGGD